MTPEQFIYIMVAVSIATNVFCIVSSLRRIADTLERIDTRQRADRYDQINRKRDFIEVPK